MVNTAQELPRRHRYTSAEYHRMAAAGIFGEDDRVELIQGEIVDMAPIGSLHAGTVLQLSRILQHAVGDRAFVWVQNPIALDQHSEPQPDLALLRPRADYYKHARPTATDVLLAIEVAESSLACDRDVKLPLYAAHGIRGAWLVDLENDRLEVHDEPTPEGYRSARNPVSLDAIALPQPPAGHVDLSGLLG